MVLSLSFIPLFPQPLPPIIAVLLAFVTFEKPQFSMPVGGLMVGLGMIYHLSNMNFIAMLGTPEIRLLVVAVLLYLFVALPIRFHTCEDAIAINMGILAATLLFFSQTYIFAVPLLLTVAVLFKKTQGALALSYYVLISAPLQIMQFSEVIPTIARADWWQDPLGVPPLYVPLSGIFKSMQESMVQFRLFDTSKVVGAIAGQITSTPGASTRNVGAALSQYLDSFPGIILFIALVLSLIMMASTIAPLVTKKNYAMKAEVLFPALTAAGITALFFLLLIGFQRPLAFRAQVNTAQIAIGTLATIFIALPVSYINYAPKKRAAIEAGTKRVMEKANELTAKLQVFEELLNKTKSSIPVDVSSPEGKTFVIKDKLNDIINKTSARLYNPSELDEKFEEMDKTLSKDINSLSPELNVLLEEYQLHVIHEYATWTKKLKAFGFEVGTAVKTDFQKEMPLETRINAVKEMLEGGRSLAEEVSRTVEQAYNIIRSLYDPTLPEESRTITFVKQQLDKKTTPWFATDALFASLSNWERQYRKDVSKSVEYLRDSLNLIVGLNVQGEKLQPILGDGFLRIADSAKRAEDIKANLENKTIGVTTLTVVSDALEASLNISRDILAVLHEDLAAKEESIENLLPVKENFWEKNVTLREQIASAIKAISSSSKKELNQVMENLPKALSHINECIDTLAIYNEKREFLLNYPVAKAAIEDLLKQKKRVSAKELPFDPRYAEEYLKLFYNQRSGEFSYDENSNSLMKKA